MTTETLPAVVNVRTGTLIEDVRAADPADLADVIDAIAEKRDELAEIENVALDELLRRLDRRGEWTWRVGDPKAGVVHTITAPSPTAGTTTVHLDRLRDELRAMLAADEIDPELAEKALKRTVTVTATVGTSADLETLRGTLEKIDAIAGVPVVDVAVSTDEKVVQAGVNALKKAGHAGVVDRATVGVPAPARRAKVKTERRPARDD
jgi:hypothetical protein